MGDTTTCLGDVPRRYAGRDGPAESSLCSAPVKLFIKNKPTVDLQYSCTRLGDLAKPLRGCDLAESLVHLSDPVVLQVRRLAVPAI